MGSVLEFQNITKYFPGVKALDNICFKAHSGEVLAFLGENGAGKSTLLKVLNGDYRPDGGKYLLDGEEKHFHTPHEAIEEGISVIYQERQILLELSVAENIFLGRMPANQLGVINVRKANEMAQKIIDDFGLPIAPSTKVKDLSIAHQQMVEIMKAYSRENLKVICFDEPTASLSDAEIDMLFAIIEKLKAQGKIIIYVSHRMNEIRRITDKVAIFKDGCYIDTVVTKDTPEDVMIKMMVGRDLGDIYEKLDREKEIGDVLLEVKNVSSDYVKEVSFTLRKGEVLGFSGLVGAGRTEVMRAIIGADTMRTGEVYLEGKKIVNRSPKHAVDNGIVLVPEDRKLQGIISNLSVAGNINISLLNKNANKLGIIDHKKETEEAYKGIENFKIKTPSPDKKIVELSGGNQQKCIVARWIATNPKVLILDEPTKGIDVGAKSEFYNMICEFAKQGLGVILISSELPEVIGLSDRIIVMKSLRIAGEVSREEATEDRLLSLGMIGEDKNE
ncbi:sugar ABC transporter ATP-binding protein [Lactonifactor longoviformis]|uniref:L-arabinose transport system ATP-binding protein n=1 Tax=Lactonifactor longoviformis DSM 17459 TaxID=1122155 RepID=A0A1M4WA07_9CLOT|nr:sugar ABC transporter ATP-binding protein [Lactonifactor longoviformis]POP31390.1 sugar ABC transporter ATP-binding protein [Lactonifactor longoviformis]SHE78047.1 L-arabinose transport system ATP-binding protein [Lactonifactor longoviformis DSM 17459]